MTDFTKKYGFALADSDSSDDDAASRFRKKKAETTQESTQKNEESKSKAVIQKEQKPKATGKASKFNNILKGLMQSDSSDSDKNDDVLAKYRAKRQGKVNTDEVQKQETK